METGQSIPCTHCGKSFRWKPVLAGKGVRCPCGELIHFPANPPEQPEMYYLESETPQEVIPVAAVASVAPPAPALPYRAKKADAAKIDPDRIKNIQMPLWLLGIGVLINIVAPLLRSRNNSLAEVLVSVAATLSISTALMLVGVLIAAKFRGIYFGPVWNTLFKLAAISVAPSGIIALFIPIFDLIPLGFFLAWIGEFILYFSLLGVLFDLDQSDTWYCIFVIFLVRLVVFFALMSIHGR